jgi:hypothetical protein
VRRELTFADPFLPGGERGAPPGGESCGDAQVWSVCTPASLRCVSVVRNMPCYAR